MFTIKELELFARMIDNTPLQGTLLSLPVTLQEIMVARRKLQAVIDETKNPVTSPVIVPEEPAKDQKKSKS